ncbi:MAG: GNAT family N-acetyltransferase [Ruminococcus sp.]|nr:GNAT family N-acetyltransferase [Ruminococcus sp.]
MTIRNMTSKDYGKVYELWINTKGMGLNNLDDSYEGISRFLERNPKTCFVAVEDKEIVGAIIAGHDGRRGYIYHTAVAEKYRHHGIGTRLVKNALSALKSEGIKKCALVVFDKNEGGNKFWETIGFSKRNDLIYRNKEIEKLIRIDT